MLSSTPDLAGSPAFGWSCYKPGAVRVRPSPGSAGALSPPPPWWGEGRRKGPPVGGEPRGPTWRLALGADGLRRRGGGGRDVGGGGGVGRRGLDHLDQD